MASLEAPQAHSQGRRGSVSSFIRSRRNRKDKDDKSNSSGAPSEVGSEHLDLSKSMSGDGAIDRMKDKLRTPKDKRGSGDSLGKRLSVSLPGKRRKKDNDEAERSPSRLAPGAELLGEDRSDDSLSRQDSVSSSQLTEDADSDSRSEQQQQQ